MNVSIFGLGLMGGSLGQALVRDGNYHVTGWGRDSRALSQARRRRAAHAVTTDLRRAATDADVAVLAVPVDRIVPLARKIHPHLKSSALVMDVGSVKAPIVSALDGLYNRPGGPAFLGAHPMAGSEKTGVENARSDLYRGATVVLTPSRRTPPSALRRAKSFWSAVGGKVLTLDPAEHDRWVALVSHLPHLLADALILTAAHAARTPAERRLFRSLAAGSFRDATRVAGADPAQWAAIFSANAAPLRAAATLFQKTLSGLVARRRPLADIQRARRFHRRLLALLPT
jgi:prephenate dehydrogenase